MKYLITDAKHNLIAKANVFHTARLIACALSNEEENMHKYIFIVYRASMGELLVRGFYKDGEFHAAHTRLTY